VQPVAVNRPVSLPTATQTATPIAYNPPHNQHDSNIQPQPSPSPIYERRAAHASRSPASSQRAHVDIVPEKRNLTANSALAKISKEVKSSNVKTLLLMSLAFLFFFVVLAGLKLSSDYKDYENIATAGLKSDMVSQSQKISQALNSQIGWMDTALALSGSPNQILNFVARGNGVAGAALIDGNNTLIAATPGAGDVLSSVDLKSFPQSGVSITSIIAKDYTTNPVIIKKKEDAYLVMALLPGILIDKARTSSSIILPSGRVIDAPADIARLGPIDYYSIDRRRLDSLTQSSRQDVVSPHKSQDEKVWMATTRIPGSSLTLVNTVPRIVSPRWQNSLLIFTCLFMGTAAIIWALIQNLMRRIKQIQDNSRDTEVSQQRFQAAIDGSNGGVWEIELTSNQVYLSRSLAKLLGLPDREQKIPIPQFLSLFHESDREALFSAVRRAHMTGPFEVDAHVAHLPIAMVFRGKPSVRGSDQGKAIIGMALDVTETRGAQTRLQHVEARLVDALTSMTDSFVVWDPMNRLVIWNERFENFFGFQPGQLQPGLEHATIVYNAEKAIEESYDAGDGIGEEILLKDGRWIRYLESSTADGGRVSIGNDITEIRAREDDLRTNEQALQKTVNVLKQSQVRIVELAENYEQEKIRAEDANQSKSEFLANMSHELRTPLNAINGFSDIMQKEMFGPLGDPRYKEYVNDILFSGQHLLSLINDILDMSKIEAGKMTLNAEVMQMNDMISQVIRIVRGRAEENRLKLIYQELDVPEIEADPRAVKQILLNLITNAIKFTPENGTVKVEVVPKSAGLIMRVHDSGIGISEEDIARLAQPFEQIESQHSRQHEGTGLGLALSKSLTELHGGNFAINSVVGQGTTVTFTLPNKPIAAKKAPRDEGVGNEISQLAEEIASVLQDDNLGDAAAQANTSPRQPQIQQTGAIPPPPMPSDATGQMHPAPAQTQPQESNGPVPIFTHNPAA